MRIPLLGAAYQGRSVIASAQRAVNLYAEKNEVPYTPFGIGDPQAPVPITYYPTPGTVLYSDPNNPRNVRCTYRTSKGTAYIVVGPTVYFLSSNQILSIVGFIADRPSQVYMADNGLAVVLVDGIGGYAIDMETNEFGQIVDPAFYGADFVVYLDTFFVFNRPGTNQFYISLSVSNFAMLTNTAIATGTITTPGTLYTNGVYQGVPLTGGSGHGATADITVSGAVVTAVDIANPGVDYMVGDILSADAANLGGTGSGFSYTVATMATAFDPLDIAAKSGSADPIVGMTTTHQELWLIGALTTEVWIGTGAADFFFQEQQGAYIDHGCVSQYSIANIDILSFWISQDKQGSTIVLQGSNYQVKEITTPRIVDEFKSYVTIDDAIGFCFQISDHAFYCLAFPRANKTWLYDLTTGLWNEWAWTDANGQLNRSRANCAMFAYGVNIIGDWENGKLWKLDSSVYKDDDVDIIRIRTIPHIMQNGNRISYKQFIADMQVGDYDDQNADEPIVYLSTSFDRGVSYGNPIGQSLGSLGNFLTQPSWNRLGMGRDCVFKLQWSAPMKTALNGAFVNYEASLS